ncbi:MAG: hypothetical protein U0840_17020 [Gemmataceae bacterium]
MSFFGLADWRGWFNGKPVGTKSRRPPRLRLEELEVRLTPATFTVPRDASDLRAALVAVSQSRDANNIIVLPAGTIKVANLKLNIRAGRSLTIMGKGADQTILSANLANRVIEVVGGTVRFRDLAIANGKTAGKGGGLLIDAGTVSLNRVVVRNCVARGADGAAGNTTTLTVGQRGQDAFGGGVYLTAGTLNLYHTTITTCQALAGKGGDGPRGGNGGVASGGGLYVANGTVIGQSCGFSNNLARGGDGGKGLDGFGGTMWDGLEAPGGSGGNGGDGRGGGFQAERGTVTLFAPRVTENEARGGNGGAGGLGSSLPIDIGNAGHGGHGGSGGSGLGGGGNSAFAWFRLVDAPFQPEEATTASFLLNRAVGGDGGNAGAGKARSGVGAYGSDGGHGGNGGAAAGGGLYGLDLDIYGGGIVNCQARGGKGGDGGKGDDGYVSGTTDENFVFHGTFGFVGSGGYGGKGGAANGGGLYAEGLGNLFQTALTGDTAVGGTGGNGAVGGTGMHGYEDRPGLVNPDGTRPGGSGFLNYRAGHPNGTYEPYTSNRFGIIDSHGDSRMVDIYTGGGDGGAGGAGGNAQGGGCAFLGDGKFTVVDSTFAFDSARGGVGGAGGEGGRGKTGAPGGLIKKNEGSPLLYGGGGIGGNGGRGGVGGSGGNALGGGLFDGGMASGNTRPNLYVYAGSITGSVQGGNGGTSGNGGMGGNGGSGAPGGWGGDAFESLGGDARGSAVYLDGSIQKIIWVGTVRNGKSSPGVAGILPVAGEGGSSGGPNFDPDENFNSLPYLASGAGRPGIVHAGWDGTREVDTLEHLASTFSEDNHQPDGPAILMFSPIPPALAQGVAPRYPVYVVAFTTDGRVKGELSGTVVLNTNGLRTEDNIAGNYDLAGIDSVQMDNGLAVFSDFRIVNTYSLPRHLFASSDAALGQRVPSASAPFMTIAAPRVTANITRAGVLTVTGTDGNDNIDIHQANGKITVAGVKIDISGTPNKLNYAWATAVKKIIVYANGGNDSVRLDQGAQAISAPTFLDGGPGDDLIVGAKHGKNQMFGRQDDDQLVAGNMADELDGGDGNDAVCGGPLTTLVGGAGRDRFLWRDSLGALPEDYRLHQAEDVLFHLDIGPATDVNIDGVMTHYTGKDWDADDILTVDRVFSRLQSLSLTKLLRKADGSELSFDRFASGRGFNEGTYIALTDNQFNSSTDYVAAYVLHEIGHNWDVSQSGWNAFLALSGWTHVFPADPAQPGQLDPRYSPMTSNPDATHGWWYLKTAQFVSQYAKNTPLDDFAESFAAYFMARCGFRWSDYGKAGDPGVTGAPDKIAHLEDWLRVL